MTRETPAVELTVKNRSENEMSISVKAEGLEPDHKAAGMIARALGSLFDIGSRELFTADDGSSTAAIIDYEGRRLIVSLPATGAAFDGETGKALAEAKTWLWGDSRAHFLAAEDVIKLRAILNNKNLPRASERATQAAMAEFGLARDEAEAATTFLQPWYGYKKEFIRTEKSTV